MCSFIVHFVQFFFFFICSCLFIAPLWEVEYMAIIFFVLLALWTTMVPRYLLAFSPYFFLPVVLRIAVVSEFLTFCTIAVEIRAAGLMVIAGSFVLGKTLWPWGVCSFFWWACHINGTIKHWKYHCHPDITITFTKSFSNMKETDHTS